MKRTLPKDLLHEFVRDAIEGSGRETEIGGGNTQVDMTVLTSDAEKYPGIGYLAGGTIRVYLNKYCRYVGHKVFAPRKKPLTIPEK